MMYSCGRMWMTSRSRGMAMARAASMTRLMSAWVTSRSFTATMPWLLKPLMCPPAMPAYTWLTSQPAISSASLMACLIELTVDSMLITTPLRSPLEGCVPMPTMSIWPAGVTSPTMAQILVVPMSSPTMSSAFCATRTSLSFDEGLHLHPLRVLVPVGPDHRRGDVPVAHQAQGGDGQPEPGEGLLAQVDAHAAHAARAAHHHAPAQVVVPVQLVQGAQVRG